MALTVPQAQTLGREHGRLRATRTYASHIPFTLAVPLARAEVRSALIWMAAHYPLPSFMHKDVYAREFFEEFYRHWQHKRKNDRRHVRRLSRLTL